MVRLNKNGGPKNPEKADRLCALFTVSVLHTHKHTHTSTHIHFLTHSPTHTCKLPVFFSQSPSHHTHTCYTPPSLVWNVCFMVLAMRVPLQDLSNKDMKRDLYIVSQVIRTGETLLPFKLCERTHTRTHTHTHTYIHTHCNGFDHLGR